jgi:hypothetical protein
MNVERNVGLNFGSVVLDNVSSDLARAATEEWASVLTFDALAFNSDRKASNPNLLWNGVVLFLIDHGFLALTWTFGVDGTTEASLYGEFNIRLHVGYQHLKNAGSTFAPPSDVWIERVTRELIDWAVGFVPNEWASRAELDRLTSFLDARKRIAENQRRQLMVVTA